MDLLLVGNPSVEHVGAHLLGAARALGLQAELLDSRRQSPGPRLLRAFCWRCLGHRPTRLRAFSREVTEAARRLRPRVLLVTGQTAPTREDLHRIRQAGVRCANFVTDDPWNPVHRAPWFLRALTAYDAIFTPRSTNIEDFRHLGCPRVEVLPFAYSPTFHFREEPASATEWERFGCDVAFIGGADADRWPWMDALLASGFSLKLYGAYWERNPRLRPFAHGHVQGADYRKAVAGARVNIVLVRRANRDGNAMRSYELPAMAACIVAEDTGDHRRLYGADGALFVASSAEVAPALTRLLADEPARRRLAETAHTRLLAGGHTYHDRLARIMETMSHD